jgi:hypothetical protein
MGFRRFFKKDGTEAVVNKLKYYFLSKSGDLTEYADKATAEAAVSDPEDRIKLSGSKGDFRRTDDLDENITVLTRIKANVDMSNVNLTNALAAEGYSGGADKVPYVSWNHAAGSLGSFAEGSSIGSIDCGGQSGIDGSALTGASVTAGSLPSGVTLASNGALSGTMPEQLASSTFTFTVSLTTGSNTSTREFTITNTADNDAPVWATSAGALTDAGVASYSVQLSASDPEGGSVTYSVVFGSLPSGLTMNSTGLVSGIVSSWGTTSNFTVQITDSVNTADRSFSIASVNNPASWSTGPSIGEVSANSFTVSATDPEGLAITYSLYSGTLPSGMTLNASTGAISGTNPGDGVTYSFTINAHDGYNDSTRAFTMSAPSPNLMGGTHSEGDCTSAGGTVADGVCQFNAVATGTANSIRGNGYDSSASYPGSAAALPTYSGDVNCPSGWSQYQNWSTMTGCNSLGTNWNGNLGTVTCAVRDTSGGSTGSGNRCSTDPRVSYTVNDRGWSNSSSRPAYYLSNCNCAYSCDNGAAYTMWNGFEYFYWSSTSSRTTTYHDIQARRSQIGCY